MFKHRRRPNFNSMAKQMADQLTPAQMIRLYDIIQPIPADDPVHQMTDDELLKELLG